MSNAVDDSQPVPKGNVPTICIAFEGHRCLISGGLLEVAGKVKEVVDNREHGSILVFDSISGRPIDLDLRGSVQQVLDRLSYAPTAVPSPPASERRGPGRPKLGVVGREVTLLPRHWDWLDGQPGGASVALRKLVEEARRSNRAKDIARQSQDAVYRFMSAMAGDLPGFEEALRAFYRGDKERLDGLIQSWPADIRDHLKKMIAGAYHDAAEAGKS